MASYAYFNATLFEFKEDEFEKTMDLMARHWREHYKKEDQQRLKDIIHELSDPIFISPILSIPRQLILAAAFKGLPTLEEPWPEEAYNSPSSDDQRRELEWVKCWYKEARNACKNIDSDTTDSDTTISLGLSDADAGFYFTLLCLDSRDADKKAELGKKAEEAFKRIIEGEGTKKEKSPLPLLLRHHHSGFYGIYKLVTEKDCPEVALEYLREAAQYSSVISGNRVVNVDCLFMCCRAVAAQRAERGLEPEVDYCLETAKELAEQSELHYRLWKAASFEVSRMRGIPANMPVNWSAAERILQIFKKGAYNRGIGGVDHRKVLETAIENLNEGWKLGMPPKILDKYMEDIEELVEENPELVDRNPELKMQGECAVTTVEYLSGNLVKAHETAKGNWKRAEGELQKWMASYSYFTSTLFRGKFEKAMGLMANHWRGYYASMGAQEQRDIISNLRDRLPVNPALSIPRHMILAAAFKGSPEYEEKYWPTRDKFLEFGHLKPDDRKRELEWVKSWYGKAKAICPGGSISLDRSHACAGFYFTLLSLDSQDAGTKAELCEEAEKAFDSIEEENSRTVVRYVKSGFYGIYKLVTKEDRPGEALEWLRKAGGYSDISGNRFSSFDSLFVCCRAVAAQRAERGLEPEVDYYLERAGKLAEQTKSELHFQLWKAASSEVSRMRGEEGQAQRDEVRAKMGPAAERILRIFRTSDATTIR